MENARLTVARRAAQDVGQRQLVVSIDGQPGVTLMYGQSLTRELPVGRHRLCVHNTLVWKTIEFDVGTGEHARFTAINRAGWGTYWMLSMFGVGPLYVTLTRDY